MPVFAQKAAVFEKINALFEKINALFEKINALFFKKARRFALAGGDGLAEPLFHLNTFRPSRI
jgi:hypothetical protein